MHTKLEALIGAMTTLIAQQETEVAFATDSSELLKMVSTPADWSAFSTLTKDLVKINNLFSFSSLSWISRNLITKVDKLSRSAGLYVQLIMHVNNVPPVWLSELF